MRKYQVERLFELGSYKNIKFTAGVEVGDEHPASASDVFAELMKDVYAAYFVHEDKLKKLNLAKTQEEKEKVFA